MLLFFHGSPDTSVLWANQFAAFCGEDGEYACEAPIMMDHNPGAARVEDTLRLSWPTQADVLHEVVLDLGLTNGAIARFFEETDAGAGGPDNHGSCDHDGHVYHRRHAD